MNFAVFLLERTEVAGKKAEIFLYFYFVEVEIISVGFMQTKTNKNTASNFHKTYADRSESTVLGCLISEVV